MKGVKNFNYFDIVGQMERCYVDSNHVMDGFKCVEWEKIGKVFLKKLSKQIRCSQNVFKT